MIGILVFVFYQFHQSPLFFNKVEVNKIEASAYKDAYKNLEADFTKASEEKREIVKDLVIAYKSDDQVAINGIQKKLIEANTKTEEIRKQVPELLVKNDALADTNDGNYIFLRFVTEHFPKGVIGILIAIIFLAAMGATAGGLNALASTTVVDFYKRIFRKTESDANYLAASRWSTIVWGIFCIIVALFASRLGNLIEAVNILGSLFYGTILGIFLVAFYLKYVSANAVFYAALIAEAFIVYAWINKLTAFLWLNVIGCLLVMILALLIESLIRKKTTD